MQKNAQFIFLLTYNTTDKTFIMNKIFLMQKEYTIHFPTNS